MGRIEELSELYLRTISIPWGKSASGAERVLMAVYSTSLERTLRARVGLFADATAQAGHSWKLVDATTWFSEWMAGQEYAQSYFETPEDLRPLVEAEHLQLRIAQGAAAQLGKGRVARVAKKNRVAVSRVVHPGARMNKPKLPQRCGVPEDPRQVRNKS